MIDSTVRLPITKECELVLFYIVDSSILEVTLFVNGDLYGESIVDVSWQYLIELMLQVSRGDLSEFIDYENNKIGLRIN
jgi:hypothetical protein